MYLPCVGDPEHGVGNRLPMQTFKALSVAGSIAIVVTKLVREENGRATDRKVSFDFVVRIV